MKNEIGRRRGARVCVLGGGGTRGLTQYNTLHMYKNTHNTDLPIPQRRVQRRLVHRVAPPDVHQHGVRGQQRQLLLAD